MKGRILKPTTDPVYFSFNHVEGGSQLTIQNGTDADLTIEVTNQDAQRLGVGGVVWSSPAQGDIVIAAGGNATLLAPYAFVRLSGSGVGGIYIAYVEKDDEDNLPVYATPSGATLYASFVNEIYYISGDYVDFDTALDITRSSSKWVWGTGAQTGQLIEVPPNTPAYQHDPVTGAPLGLSVEGSATNSLTQAINFASSQWIKGADATASISSFPSLVSGLDAYDLTDNNAVGFGRLIDSVSYPANSTATSSVYIRKSAVSESFFPALYISVSGGTSKIAIGLLDTFSGATTLSTASSVLPSNVEVGAEDAGSYWRFYVKVSDVDSNTLWSYRIYPAASSDFSGITNSATGTVTAFLAQIELGSKPTSPIITAGSTATRAADVVTSDAATFGDWYRTSGTLTVTAKANVGDIVARLGSIEIVADVDTEKEYSVTYTTDPLATELELLPSGNGYIKQVTFKE